MAKKNSLINKRKSFLSLVNYKIKNNIKFYLRNNFITKELFEKIENTKNHNKRNFTKNKNLKKIKI